MAIAVECQCGQHYHTRGEHAGKRLKCPACGAPISVPNTEPQEPDVYRIADAPPVEPPNVADPLEFTAHSRRLGAPAEPGEKPRAIAYVLAVVAGILALVVTLVLAAVISFKGFGIPLDKYAIIKWPALILAVSLASGAFVVTRDFVT